MPTGLPRLRDLAFDCHVLRYSYVRVKLKFGFLPVV